MSIFHLPLTQIDRAQLDALVANAVGEGRQLDYKETLPGGTDEDKREFLSDVTSFANAVGGDLIFGIKERRDAQGRATGEPDAVCGVPNLNVDAEKLRLENLIRDGVAPRLPSLSFHEVTRPSQPSCLLVRVPRAFGGLHMVTFKNLSRFYSRNSSGKYQLDVTEIRSGFLASESAHERIRRLRADRVARILAGETPANVGEGPKVILHALPLISSSDAWARFGALNERDIIPALTPIQGHAIAWRFNLDGFVVHTQRDDPSINSYTQLFRDGGVEAVSGGVIRFDHETSRAFYGATIETRLVKAFTGYQRAWSLMRVDPPIVVGLVVGGVQGSHILTNLWHREGQAPIDRDVLVMPDVIVDDLSARAPTVLRPVFDQLWNAGGWPRSPNPTSTVPRPKS